MKQIIFFLVFITAISATSWPFTVVKDATYGRLIAMDVNNTAPKKSEMVNITFSISCLANWTFFSSKALINGPCKTNLFYPPSVKCIAKQTITVSARYQSWSLCSYNVSNALIWDQTSISPDIISVNFTMPRQVTSPSAEKQLKLSQIEEGSVEKSEDELLDKRSPKMIVEQ